MKLTSPLDIAYARLFGYDIFISYTRADAKVYAAKLHEQLTSMDYSCFLDRKEVPIGSPLNSSLVAAIKGSRTFVLVATDKALSRQYVQLEFEQFAASLRPIIPINVDLALSEERMTEKPWSVIKERDLTWIDEVGEAVKSGVPSPEVYEGIQNLFQFTRRKVVRRRLTTFAALLLFGAAVLAIWQARDARTQKERADGQRLIVEQQTRQLEKTNNELEETNKLLLEQQGTLEERNAELQTNKTLLEAKKKEALDSAKKAQEQEKLALDNARRAERQLAHNHHLLYGSNMKLAYSAYEREDFYTVRKLLSAYLPSESRSTQDDLRGFEWFHLWHLRRKEPVTLSGKIVTNINSLSDSVHSVAFSPDGKVLAVGVGRGVELWDTGTQQKLRTLQLDIDSLNKVTFSHDGKMLAVWGSYGVVKIWNAHTYQVQKTFKVRPLSSDYASLDFSPDSKLLAFTDGESVRLWDTSSWGESKSLLVPGVSVIFSPDGKVLAVGVERSVRLWSTSTWIELTPLSVEGVCKAMAFSPDGKMFAAIGNGVHLWYTSPWEKSESWRPSHGIEQSLEFSPDGQTLAMGSFNGDVSLWDTSTGKKVAVLKGHSFYVSTVAFSPDGKTLATGSGDTTTNLWDVSWRQNQVPLIHSGSVSVAFSPDDKTLAATQREQVSLCDTMTRQVFKTLAGHTGRVSSVAFSADGKVLATGSEDRTVRIWDTSSWQEKMTLRFPSSVELVTFSPYDDMLAIHAKDDSLRLWDIKNWKELPGLKGNSRHTRFVAFSRDGRLVTADGALRLWHLKTRKLLSVLDDGSYSYPVTVSPDGKMLAAVALNGLTLWDMGTLRQLGGPQSYNSSISSAEFSHDGKTLVTAGFDHGENGSHHIRMWDTETRQELALLKTVSRVQAMAFSHNGKMLVLGLEGSFYGAAAVMLWYAATNEEIGDFVKRKAN